jgi:uncharacterized protein
MALMERMKADLLASMKARDAVRVATLRTMISAMDNAGAVPVDTHVVPLQGITPDVPRRELSEQEQLEILRGEADGRRKAVAEYTQLGQREVVARLQAELDVLAEYLL